MLFIGLKLFQLLNISESDQDGMALNFDTDQQLLLGKTEKGFDHPIPKGVIHMTILAHVKVVTHTYAIVWWIELRVECVTFIGQIL